jgi:hypothetical protein
MTTVSIGTIPAEIVGDSKVGLVGLTSNCRESSAPSRRPRSDGSSTRPANLQMGFIGPR